MKAAGSHRFERDLEGLDGLVGAQDGDAEGLTDEAAHKIGEMPSELYVTTFGR